MAPEPEVEHVITEPTPVLSQPAVSAKKTPKAKEPATSKKESTAKKSAKKDTTPIVPSNIEFFTALANDQIKPIHDDKVERGRSPTKAKP